MDFAHAQCGCSLRCFKKYFCILFSYFLVGGNITLFLTFLQRLLDKNLLEEHLRTYRAVINFKEKVSYAQKRVGTIIRFLR